MDTVTHREMRNNSGDLLRRAQAGESVLISNNGHVAAMLVPAPLDSLDVLVDGGQARSARKPISTLSLIRRSASDRTSAQIIDDVRGRW
ncbi:type II toxin-antitoxin system Phd/YefM family antitoxin [Frondihabitans australicus]|uniref:Prevent-host-death family protein n=1 Tax=Frondihabitans australicus TaxID=386892 RepID=A0A495IJ47_9MICO|nr:type II toxin-antitoxin system prevent-host-death family antitoxin [Frondihabitans australicus]RKR75997.1 prevent-host-death family protein [Frondihabitans australicus]